MKPIKDNNLPIYKGHNNSKEIKGFLAHELPNYHNVPEHNLFIDCAHKSQKITTAIYMITDLISEIDPLVQQLRSHSVIVMNKLYSMTALPQSQRVQKLSETSTLIYGLSSYLQVLHHNAKISAMNHTLIVNELSTLQNHINKLLTKNLPYDRRQQVSQLINEFSFSEDFFKTSEHKKPRDNQFFSSNIKDEEPATPSSIKDTSEISSRKVKDKRMSFVKDIKKTNIGLEQKREVQEKIRLSDNKDSASVKPKNQSISSKGQIEKNTESLKKTKATKGIRHENILKILKQKKDAKIGDITSLITDYGAKTIQRDLNELVHQGMVSKEGDRRWSVYNLSY